MMVRDVEVQDEIILMTVYSTVTSFARGTGAYIGVGKQSGRSPWLFTGTALAVHHVVHDRGHDS